jgi:hypothetical protein
MVVLMAQQIESRSRLIESVYDVIRENSGKVRSVDLDSIIGNAHDVRFAITRLTIMGRIRRVRGFGARGVEYFYHDIQSESFAKHRRMERRMLSGIMQRNIDSTLHYQ